MKNLLIFYLVLKAKLIAYVSRVFGKGQGTSLPGLSVEKKHQSTLSWLTKDFEQIILISGTNGKTTTRALINHIFTLNGKAICSNQGGANLVRGIASSLLLNRNLFFKPKAKIGIFEVEEASLPILTKYIKPNKLILTNIFRDQLDAYGEIDKTKTYFIESIENILFDKTPDFGIIYNGEDGMLTDLVANFDVKKTSFIVDGNQKINYEKKVEKKSKKSATLIAKNIAQQKLSLNFEIVFNKKTYSIDSILPGSYNIYNILAAFSVTYPFFKKQAIEAIKTFKPVFGRGEKIQLSESKLTLFLIKNPVGFDQVLSLLNDNFKNEKINLAICINDKIADGKDVSWLWDSDLETVIPNLKTDNLLTSGSRGLDMLLRLQFAGADVNENNYINNLNSLFEKIKSEKKDFVVLCTYTALLEFRKIISTHVKIPEINSAGN